MKQDEFIKEWNTYFNSNRDEKSIHFEADGTTPYDVFNFINHLLSKQPSEVWEDVNIVLDNKHEIDYKIGHANSLTPTDAEKDADWCEVINDARWYDGTPQGLIKLTEHLKSKFTLYKQGGK